MPIRPIDMITMPPRSQEASQLHQAENQRQTHAQEQPGIQFGNQVVHDSQKTVKSQKSENNEERYDAKEEGKGGAYSGNSKKKKKDEDKKKKEIRIGNFDMRI